MDHTTNLREVRQSMPNQFLNFLPVANMAAVDHDIGTDFSQRFDVRGSLTSECAAAREQHEMSRTFLYHPLGHLSTEATCATDKDVRSVLPQQLNVSFDTWRLGQVSTA